MSKKFTNTTIFFIPCWCNDYSNLRKNLQIDHRYELIPNDVEENDDHLQINGITTDYLLNYVDGITKDQNRFISYRYKNIQDLKIHWKNYKISFEPDFAIFDIRLSCFQTGACFYEIWVSLNHMTIDQIIDFTNRFKSADHTEKYAEEGYQNLYHTLESIKADPNLQLFFTSNSSLKRECLCYHMIKLNQEYSKEEINQYLTLLKRNYNTNFMNSTDEIGNYDMYYHPYENDHWAGSQEGLVNFIEQDCDNWFYQNIKYLHLTNYFYYIYLLLLNQRYTLIQYIHDIAKFGVNNHNKNELDELNKKIVELKTVFSYRVVSNDLIIQNVYAKMYKILDIENLLADIQENESQLSIIRDIENQKIDSKINHTLYIISFLSIASFLIDSASYFDRYQQTASLSNGLGIIILICVLIYAFKNLKR